MYPGITYEKLFIRTWYQVYITDVFYFNFRLPLPFCFSLPPRAAAMIRSWMRRMVVKFGVQAQNVAVARIQRAWLRRARNRWLEARVGRVFAIARAGDVDAMMRELRDNPDVLFMRDRWGRWRDGER